MAKVFGNVYSVESSRFDPTVSTVCFALVCAPLWMFDRAVQTDPLTRPKQSVKYERTINRLKAEGDWYAHL
jgi:hypothetical protein